jgi:Asp-tRNA(Asn)/Glu-tRNA(Gln) amidotransferase A subunit family amidase
VTDTPPRSTGAGGTCQAAVDDFLDAVARREPALNAFVQIDEHRLRAEAAERDALPTDARGPMHGWLVAVKEVFDVAGYRCGWGTPIHRDRIPTADAAAVRLIRGAGAVVAGITVSTEYAMSRIGPTVNPWNPARTPGASSQGSAAAVGAGLVPLALGSQTIGSVIRPAAYCGCIGFKPTWGAVDGAGNMPLAPPIDHVGLMADSLDHAQVALAVLAPALAADTRPDRVLVLRPWYRQATDRSVSAAVRRAGQLLARSGLALEPARVPGWVAHAERPVLDAILARGVAENHGADALDAGDLMSERMRNLVVRGRAISDNAYAMAIEARERIAQSLDAMLGTAVALAPATTGIAPLRTQGTGSRDPQRIWTLAGCPTMTIPFATVSGMPLGVQLIAARGQDHALLAAAELLRA